MLALLQSTNTQTSIKTYTSINIHIHKPKHTIRFSHVTNVSRPYGNGSAYAHKAETHRDVAINSKFPRFKYTLIDVDEY